MKSILSLLLLFSFVFANAQTEEEKLTATMKEFHQAFWKCGEERKWMGVVCDAGGEINEINII